MENASQALIIGGGILLAILVLTVGLYLIVSYSEASESYEQSLSMTEITKFNANFTKFIGRKDITAQEIITLKNFAENYDKNHGTSIIVKYQDSNLVDTEFIKKYSGKMEYFECDKSSILYNENGSITKIEFKKTR